MLRAVFLIFVLSLSLSPHLHAVTPKIIGSALVFSTEGDFDNVKQDLILTIEDQGMVISYTSHASTMLERTADAVGSKAGIYDKAEIVLFCKASLSHNMVNENPHNIVMCPYAVSIYTLKREKDRVYLSIRQPAVVDIHYAPIYEMLIGIIRQTIEG
jgi:uncharacterized protein (DUF302 family)